MGIRRGSFRSVEDLEKAITEFMAVWNENPNPLSAPPPRNRSCRSYRVVDKPWNRFGRLYPTRQPKAPGFPTTRETHLQGNSSGRVRVAASGGKVFSALIVARMTFHFTLRRPERSRLPICHRPISR